MPLVSVITAAYAPKAGYLPDTAASVAAQQLPPGWELEWLVQEDGDGPSLLDVVAGVPSARYEANDALLGIAATRNLALSRARGELLRVLDHDDVLLPGALGLGLAPFVAAPGTWWAFTAADELDPVGRRRAQPAPPVAGAVPRGVLGLITDASGRW